MNFAASPTPAPADSADAQRYNRTRRWLGIADFVVGLAFLIVLLVTGWSGGLRDFAYRLGAQNYTLSVFLYLLLLLVIGKVLGFGLDYFGFRVERKFKLSNQKLGSWIWDEVKGFMVGVVLGGVLVELLYFTIRQSPQHWWFIVWAMFMGLFVLMAQLAPVVLFPI
jgi:STE24 endopeptidase